MKHLPYILLLGASIASAQTAIWPGGVVSDAQLLVASNLCGSRLSAPIVDTTSTTIFVVNAAVNSTCFLVNEEVQVDNEFMQILSVGTGQLTVSRAFDHSTASTHQVNAPVNVTAAAWYHNQSRLEIESIEAWLKAGGGGGGGSTTYNQGSANAVNQTVTGKFQQTIALDDFGCNPSNSASQNNIPCQNAINYAAANAMALHCAGVYNISVALTPPAASSSSGETILRGEGVSWVFNIPTGSPAGCTINQTNSAVAVFSYNSTAYAPLTLQDLELEGGTNSVELVNNSLGGPLTFRNVSFQYYTHAGLYIDGTSASQGLYTDHCRWLAGSNSANGVQLDAVNLVSNPGVISFLTNWTSNHDLWTGGLHGILADSDGNSSGWSIEDPHFEDMYGSPMVLAGNIFAVSIRNFGAEATGAGDNGGSLTNPMWNTTTGTTTVPNSSTIVVASGTRLGAGTTLHIAQAGGTANTVTAGFDFDTVIQSCSPSCGNSGSTTITVSPVIPFVVTGVPVTNSQSNGMEFVASTVNTALHPTYISVYDSIGCISNFTISDAGSCRSTIYNPNGAIVGVYDMHQGAPSYDPGGYFDPVINSFGLVRTAPFSQVNSFVQPGLKTFTGSTIYPTVFAGNPGANGGEFHWGCGDGNTTTYSSSCSTTGTYGDVVFMAANANRGRPAFTISYNTGTVSIGPRFNIGGALANLSIGPGTVQTSLSNGINLYDGIAPSTHAAANNQIVAVSGVLYHYDPSGVAHNLDSSGLTLTTTGSSGASTLVGNTLNIPVYGTGSGTVTVVGGGNLTSTAFMTGGGSQTAQTPSATSTLSSGGNAVFAGTVAGTAGLFGASPPSVSGNGLFAFTETTVPTGAASSIDLCYADSTQHGLLCSFNNSSFLAPLLQTANDTTTSHVLHASATNGQGTFSAIAAGDLPAALSSSTSLNGVTMGSAVGNATIAQTVANGATAMGTPTVISGTCSTAITATATGAATTDVISATPAVDPSGVSGYAPNSSGSLYIIAWVTSNTANFKLCNNTSGSITPAAMTMNWRISR